MRKLSNTISPFKFAPHPKSAERWMCFWMQSCHATCVDIQNWLKMYWARSSPAVHNSSPLILITHIVSQFSFSIHIPNWTETEGVVMRMLSPALLIFYTHPSAQPHTHTFVSPAVCVQFLSRARAGTELVTRRRESSSISALSRPSSRHFRTRLWKSEMSAIIYYTTHTYTHTYATHLFIQIEMNPYTKKMAVYASPVLRTERTLVGF